MDNPLIFFAFLSHPLGLKEGEVCPGQWGDGVEYHLCHRDNQKIYPCDLALQMSRRYSARPRLIRVHVSIHVPQQEGRSF